MSAFEEILQAILDGGDPATLSPPESRGEVLLQALLAKINELSSVGGGTYELIDTITVNEVCTGVSRIVEPDTTPYNFKGLILECFFGPITPGNLTCDFFGIGTDQMESTIGSVLLPNFGHAENPSFFQLYCELVHGIWRTWAVPPAYSTPVQANEYYAEEFILESHIPVCSGFVLGTASGIAIPIDSVIRVYGIR